MFATTLALSNITFAQYSMARVSFYFDNENGNSNNNNGDSYNDNNGF